MGWRQTVSFAAQCCTPSECFECRHLQGAFVDAVVRFDSPPSFMLCRRSYFKSIFPCLQIKVSQSRVPTPGAQKMQMIRHHYLKLAMPNGGKRPRQRQRQHRLQLVLKRVVELKRCEEATATVQAVVRACCFRVDTGKRRERGGREEGKRREGGGRERGGREEGGRRSTKEAPGQAVVRTFVRAG